MAEGDLPHRERAVIAREGHAKERPCTGDVLLGQFLGEVFEDTKRRRTVLDLVENEQRSSGFNVAAERKAKVSHDAPGIVGSFEKLCVLAWYARSDILEGDIGNVVKALCTKLPERPCLANLTRPLEDERLMPSRRPPLLKICHDVTLHLPSFQICGLPHILLLV